MKVRTTIDLPIELIQWATEQAKREGVSRNRLFQRAVEEYKARKEAEKRERKDEKAK